jgi:chitinase
VLTKQSSDDIKTCQSNGKKILLSIGGATYSEGGFSSSDAAVAGANHLWEVFGPQQSGSSAPRPFDDAVIDGFDFDFEATANNIAPFASQLRSLMDADASKTFYLSAAPQCPYPDAYDSSFMQGATSLDLVWVQFYNNVRPPITCV